MGPEKRGSRCDIEHDGKRMDIPQFLVETFVRCAYIYKAG